MARSIAGSAAPAVVVMNMHYTGLGIARALRGTGYEVIGVGADATFLGAWSRYARFVVGPDSALQPEECARFLLDLAAQLGRPALLCPTRDQDVSFIMRFRAELAQGYRFVGPDNATIARIFDKDALFEVAAQCGVACPRSILVNSVAELEAVLGTLEFPCLAKPLVASQWRVPHVWQAVNRNKAVIIDEPGALRRLYAKIVDDAPSLLIQEYIRGGDESLVIFGSYRSPRDRSLTYFTGRKLLQFPPLTGSGVAVECCPVPQIVESSLRLLEQLDYVGVSEIEYKVDRASGAHKLIEINPRHWDQHLLGDACGVNITRVLADDVFEVPGRKVQQNERRVIWLAEDRYARLLIEQTRSRTFDSAMHRYVLRSTWLPAVISFRDLGPLLRTMVNGVSGFAKRIATLVRPRSRAHTYS